MNFSLFDDQKRMILSVNMRGDTSSEQVVSVFYDDSVYLSYLRRYFHTAIKYDDKRTSRVRASNPALITYTSNDIID